MALGFSWLLNDPLVVCLLELDRLHAVGLSELAGTAVNNNGNERSEVDSPTVKLQAEICNYPEICSRSEGGSSFCFIFMT